MDLILMMQTYSDRKLAYDASTCSHTSYTSIIRIHNRLNLFISYDEEPPQGMGQ